MASRPKTLWAAIAPVIIGTAMAFSEGDWHPLSAIFTAISAIFIQIGTNFANDYFDHLQGADEGNRLGPTRVTQAGLVSAKTMKKATFVVFTIAFLAGLYLVYRGGWPILIIGLTSIMLGILYTGGPFPLGYYGFGDLFVLLFFGIIAVGGTYYVQTLSLNLPVLVAGIAPGLFSTGILTVNNLRDIHTDRAAGKRTLAVRFGATFARFEYFFTIFFACLIPVWFFYYFPVRPFVLLATSVFFFAIPSLRIVFKEKPGKIMNQVLANTGKLLLMFSILFSIGWNL
jgi:1,4-dihydroxy-2-naphthoate octaprenyltransferase